MRHPDDRAGIASAAWCWPASSPHGAWQARAAPVRSTAQATPRERAERAAAPVRGDEPGLDDDADAAPADDADGGRAPRAAAASARAAAARCADRRHRHASRSTAPVSGEVVAAAPAGHAPRRQQAVPDRRPEQRDRRVGSAAPRASATASSRPACSSPTAPARSTRSSTPSSCRSIQAFAEAIGASADFPDMLDVVARGARARRLRQPARRAARGAPARAARRRGASATSSSMRGATASCPAWCRAAWCCPSTEEGAPPVLTLTFDSQAALADEPDRAAVRDVTLTLRRAADRPGGRALRGLAGRAQALAVGMDAASSTTTAGRSAARASPPSASELGQLYATLEARDLAAGSAAARRLFS